MSEPVSPVTVQIVRNRIASLMEEMDYRFYRSGYSTIVRESRDFSCVVTDRTGRLAVAPFMYFHAPVYFHLIQRVLEIYGEDGLDDGDVLVCNHPYEGSLPHVPDMALVRPVFADGALVAFTASIAHKADVGGAVAGSTWGQATDLFQEGMLLPPVKIVRKGNPNLDLERLIAGNSRAPELVLGDMHAQIGVTGIGRDRLVALCTDIGRETFVQAFDAIIDASARNFAASMARLPDGENVSEGFMDDDGVSRQAPIKIRVRVEVKDGRVHFDFTGSAPQTRGPANLRIAMVEACAFYCLIGFLDKDIPYSDAARDLVRFTFPERSVVSPQPPAPCSSYMKTCQKVVDVMLQALDPFMPGRAIANVGGSASIMVAWQDGVKRNNQYEIFGSAYGAGAGHDGTTGVTVHLANIFATPIEIVESEFPCRVARYEAIPDTGGRGEFRGGLAYRRDYELLAPAAITYRADRAEMEPLGLAGGEAGAKSRFLLAPETPDQRQFPSSFREIFEAGTVFSIQTAGGGGYGDPAKRDAAAVARDEAEGYVSRKS
jgi:N-methylhydantoinase B